MQIAQKNFYKKFLGRAGEIKAAEFLEKKGFKILKTNFKTHLGEIDIIAEDNGTLVFVEVKTRSVNAIDRPASAVGYAKQRRLITTAQHYLTSNPTELQPRFDVAEVITQDDKVTDFNYIENAFQE